MRLNRTFAILVLAASLAGGLLPQARAAPDDQAIFSAVEQLLLDARSLAAARIRIRSLDGYVTLTGVADTVEDIATAGRLAALVRGVTGVSNRLSIADRPWRT